MCSSFIRNGTAMNERASFPVTYVTGYQHVVPPGLMGMNAVSGPVTRVTGYQHFVPLGLAN